MEPIINNLNNIMRYLLLMLAAALGMVCHADNAVRRVGNIKNVAFAVGQMHAKA